MTSVIGKKNGYFYHVTVIAASPKFGHTEIKSICSGWKWNRPASPASHLDMGSGARMFDRKLTVRYPRLMRPHPSTQPGRDFAVALLNLNSDAMQEFSIQATPIPKNSDITLEELCKNFSIIIQRNLETKELSWKKSTNQDLYLSSLTSANLTPGRKGPIKSYLRYAIIELSDFNVLVQFTVMTASHRDLEKYDAFIEKVVGSITVLK